MTKEELATLINGREYRNELSKSEEKKAEESDLVVVFGASDDLMEFRGAIYDEFGCYDGGESLIDSDGLLPDREAIDDDDELEEYFLRKKKARKITAVWNDSKYPTWSYRTDIPHVTFNILEEGDVYCRGIIFELKALSDTVTKEKKSPKRNRDRSQRPSPSESATIYDIGFEAYGNDNNLYVVGADKNGTHRWIRKR